MQSRLLTSLAIAVCASASSLAHASSDDSCYPTWSILSEQLDPCSNLPFLSPGNDSSVNLRLLLANAGKLQLSPTALNMDDLAEGYGEVPFAHYRLLLVHDDIDKEVAKEGHTLGLNEMLATLGIKREPAEVAGDMLVDGEGSRCRSNNETTATDFIRELIKTPELSPAERAALANSRMQMLPACGWEPEQLTSLLPGEITSTTGKAFTTYLQAAADFYSGRFVDASKGFTLLADNPNEWLKDTALYMIGRTELNLAQEKAFEYGELRPERVDLAAARRAESAFRNYLDNYPYGVYSNTATGLLRRVHWLTQDKNKLAADYETLLFGPGEDNPAYEALVREADLKLITPNTTAIKSPMIAAVNDLMWMREGSSNKLTKASLMAQKDTFAEHPELFTYLQAAFALYVENDPDSALKLLPTDIPDTLGYLAFSQQMLRGQALEASQDWKAAQDLWLQLLPLARLPLQNEQLQLALAMSYERDEQLAKVFAADSPIKAEKLRYILLSKTADADLLIQQTTQGISETERNTALFVLLYKDLMRSQFARFGEDLKLLPDAPSPEKLGYSLGYVHNQGPSLSLFRWKSSDADSGYACPDIAEIAAVLAKDAINPRSLNCMGEFIRGNNLDGMPLDDKRNPAVLGGTPPGYVKRVFARHTAYQAVIVNPKAGHEDKAYALYRAINCYAPSGNNGCGGKAVEPSVRKAWFKQLKSGFADTPWSKSLQYYW
ncbi:outer membrane assembly lipoprotein YfiO [Pseudomonas quasicaspiana]|uniref:outer membrane assembly lipoprotein YfiO n=1 Tax=Pseudomonas quasicaspiana TaxID=2829821 RepID=UPI001E4DB81F|nr:outer membrane assembly lipoprotein YfiO [Pseudomonas quasicaspiana]MCD5975030.1 outer membrane assembly lipoprotein YfiO [Pseudomonas quasicaspiana]